MGSGPRETYAGAVDPPVELWPAGKRAGLSLTFDDGLVGQLDHAVPMLDRFGLKATFFPLPWRVARCSQRWRAVARTGHEIGNHTVTHPCSSNREWSRNNGLEDYSLERMQGELEQADDELERLTGRRPASFAYPCGQGFVGRGSGVRSYVPLVAQRYVAGRGSSERVAADPARCDLAQIPGLRADGRSFDELLEMIHAAFASRRWLVLVVHDVREQDRPGTLALATFEQLCRYVAAADELWVSTLTAIATHISNRQSTWELEEREISA